MSQTRHPRSNAPGPRLLMSRLRTMMAAGGTIKGRLANLVELVAVTMIADVCSIYLRARDDCFDLVATEGLRQDAIGTTRLKPNEGLVSVVAETARPLSVQNAPAHPNFSYRPETGEDPYNAFLGVPLLKGGRVVGVMVVQNKTERIYDEEEVETLQTIAMVVSEMISANSSTDDDDALDIEMRPTRPVELRGRTLSGGIAMGTARLHDPVVPITKIFAADLDEEVARMEEGLSALRKSIDTLLARDSAPLWGETRDVLETFRLMAHDPSWNNRLIEAVRSGLSAEAAVDRVRQEHRARLEHARDGYLRERLHDLEDLDNRLLRLLSKGENGKLNDGNNMEGDILIARRLGPAELLEYKGAGLAGIVLEEGGAASHAAIVARALDLPAVGSVPHLMSSVSTDDQIIIDADRGKVFVRPDDNHSNVYQERIELRGQRRAQYAKIRDKPAVTKDGIHVELMLNAGLSLDIEHMREAGGDGIGLFRTEFQFLVSETLPKLGEQIEFYKSALDAAGDKPVLFRTLDLGGDKIIPTIAQEREENPALGWRSIRLALERHGLFRRQIRALIRAAGERPLSVMFPLVASVEEFDDAREMVLQEFEWTKSRGYAVTADLKIGAMIETPALALAIPQLADRADFLSVGTNDLMQYFYAADRENPKLADRYDILSYPSMMLMKTILELSQAADIKTSVCGEAAGRRVEALALICLGYRRLSMSAGEIGSVKQMIRSIELSAILPEFNSNLSPENGDIRKVLLNFLKHTGQRA